VRRWVLLSIARLVAATGLLHLFLSISERWGIRRGTDRAQTFTFLARRKHAHFLILTYHRVTDVPDPFFGGVPVQDFRRQMEMLRAYFNVFPLEELVVRMAKGDVPPKAVAITFDDGYRDNYQNAFPILKQLGLPATIFLVTGALDSTPLIWHDQVFDAFRRTRAGSMVIEEKEYPLKTLAEKCHALNIFLQHLRKQNPYDRDMLIQQLVSRLGITETNYNNAHKLSWRDIKYMSEHNITFGAHTVTHPILSRMPLADAVQEIVKSKETIEKKVGRSVRLFAYPNGSLSDFNESIKRALKVAGFLCAVTSVWGTNSIQTDPFELRRVGIWNSDPCLAALKLGYYKFIAALP
jgi:peptidoglycan/xylan/chitin deacetylase (PgdA/CDA1 family)